MAPDPKVATDIVMPDNFLGALATVSGSEHWDDQNATVAVAIALAESGGRPGAIGHNTNGSSDWGLWQINDHAHADLLSSATGWADPIINQSMAFRVWQQAGGRWTPWSTYSNGRYQMYMGRAQAAIRNRDFNGYAAWHNDYVAKAFTARGVDSVTSGDVTGVNTENPLFEIVKLIGKIFDPKTWISVGLIFTGSVMLLLVGWQLMKNTKTVKGVTSTVKKVVKVATPVPAKVINAKVVK